MIAMHYVATKMLFSISSSCFLQVCIGILGDNNLKNKEYIWT